LCADPACASPLETLTVDGGEAAPTMDLPRGPVFWRVSAAGLTGPTWRFDVAPGNGGAFGLSPDYDRDGYDDVAVGAPFAAESAGRVAIHRGGSSGTTAGASAVLRGAVAGAEFGSALACAGDLDGDGFADLAVGSPREGAAGRVRVFFGGPGGIPEEGARIVVLEAPSDEGVLFGGAIAGAGDLDGDGY